MKGRRIGMAAIPALGGSVCGDAAWVWEDKARIRLVVVDVAGHGRKAARVCRHVMDSGVLVPSLDIGTQMRRLHEQLHGTVGAAGMVMDICIHAQHTAVEWVGVGNVRMWSAQTQSTPQQGRPGLLGHRLPTQIRHHHVDLGAEEPLFVATDGVLSSAEQALRARSVHASCETWAHMVLHDHHRFYDDATLVIVHPRLESM